METGYSDINKKRISSKFSDKSTDKVSVYGAENVKRYTLNVAFDKLITDYRIIELTSIKHTAKNSIF